MNLGSPIFKLYSVFAMVRIPAKFTENQEHTVYRAPVKGEHLGEEKARKCWRAPAADVGFSTVITILFFSTQTVIK